MGNRILKESICTSSEIDALTWFEETLFYRLLVTVDDFGVYRADPILLAHILFPRKESVTRKMVEEALKHLEEQNLIRRYTADGDPYLYILTWNKHQRLRTTTRKFPGPDEADTGMPRDAEGPGDPDNPENPEKPETPERPKGPEKQEPAKPEQPECTEPAVISLPLNDGTEYPLTQRDADEYAALYPAVDIPQELRAIRGWLLNNERRRKTRAGIRRFVNNWLARAQDRGNPRNLSSSPPGYSNNPYRMMTCEGEVV